jgi:hypothetical protein
VAELVSLQDEYMAWLDSLPPSLENSATAEALRSICDLGPVTAKLCKMAKLG